MDLAIDDVIALVHQEPPDYRTLYYRWEAEQWAAGEIDLTADRDRWRSMPVDRRRAFLSAVSPFYVGAEQVTLVMVPFVDAAPSEEQQVFLSTQLVDAARHLVFFDRFLTEVAEEKDADVGSVPGYEPAPLDEGWRRLLRDSLPEVADAVRDGSSSDPLVAGITLQHLVIEGTLGLTQRRSLSNVVVADGAFPGFRRGFTAAARDASRHIAFGLRFLRETVAAEPGTRDVVTRTLEEAMPLVLSALDTRTGDADGTHPMRQPAGSDGDFARDLIDGHRRAIGLSAS